MLRVLALLASLELAAAQGIVDGKCKTPGSANFNRLAAKCELPPHLYCGDPLAVNYDPNGTTSALVAVRVVPSARGGESLHGLRWCGTGGDRLTRGHTFRGASASSPCEP